MPYIDNPDFEFPDPITYDVLMRKGDGTEELLAQQPAEGGLLESARAACERYQKETDADADWLDAWVTNGRIWADEDPQPIPMEEEL